MYTESQKKLSSERRSLKFTPSYLDTDKLLKPEYSIGDFEFPSIFQESVAFSLQTSENNLKPP